MDERVIQFRVGVVIVAATIITGVLIMLFGEGFRRRYTVFIEFDQAPGVSVDTPVRKSGVLIGRISRVQLLEEGGVQLTAKIDREYNLWTNETCRISTASLLGDAVVEFVPSREEAPGERIEPDTWLEGEVASDPLQVLVDMQDRMATAFNSIENAGNQVSVLVDNVNTIVTANESQIERIAQKSEQTLDTLQTALATIEQVMGDEELQIQLRNTIQELPAVFEEARELMGEASDTFDSFQRVSQGFQRVSDGAERNLANLESFTTPLKEQAPELMVKVGRSVNRVDQLLEELLLFSQALNRGEGTLSKLVTDDELYQRLEKTTDNIEEATRLIRPILADVRVFTDKIATDPRQLGVKGALDRRPSGVGLKSPIYPSW